MTAVHNVILRPNRFRLDRADRVGGPYSSAQESCSAVVCRGGERAQWVI